MCRFRIRLEGGNDQFRTRDLRLRTHAIKADRAKVFDGAINRNKKRVPSG
jgi:hypothetical protein